MGNSLSYIYDQIEDEKYKENVIKADTFLSHIAASEYVKRFDKLYNTFKFCKEHGVGNRAFWINMDELEEQIKNMNYR